jgi:putative FmdB family regulatory protein
MPIYEYRCLNCQELFEMLVMKSDEADIRCPKCDGSKAERVMSTTHFAMTAGEGGNACRPSAQTRTCSSGSCTTYDIPGPG